MKAGITKCTFRPMTFVLFQKDIPPKCVCAALRHLHHDHNRGADTPYDILGVKPTASAKEVKSAFINLSKQYHPDTNPEDTTLNVKFVKIVDAYTFLLKKKPKPLGNKHTGEGFTYSESTSFSDDPLYREHHDIMSSREYFHYERGKLEEELEKKAIKAQQVINDKRGSDKRLSTVLIPIVAVFVFILWICNFFKKSGSIQGHQPSGFNAEQINPYYKNLEYKLREKHKGYENLRQEQMAFRKKRQHLMERHQERLSSIPQVPDTKPSNKSEHSIAVPESTNV